MQKSTKIERHYLAKIVKYCETHPGITPAMLFARIGYKNHNRVQMFMNGECSISLNTMGRLDEYMRKNKWYVQIFKKIYEKIQVLYVGVVFSWWPKEALQLRVFYQKSNVLHNRWKTMKNYERTLHILAGIAIGYLIFTATL